AQVSKGCLLMCASRNLGTGYEAGFRDLNELVGRYPAVGAFSEGGIRPSSGLLFGGQISEPALMASPFPCDLWCTRLARGKHTGRTVLG
ncbi:hypothetical protein NDU88_000773, partial [Pleurodeles waltl]